ncbi:MAG TPA: hypothetical protein VH619_13915 [Verrucomicrobiae bacterium]|nr:hypothetical protein [Verrucomicrobiae bacterium]
MKVLILPLCIWLAVGLSCFDAAAEIMTAESSSRQFIAREFQLGGVPAAAGAILRSRSDSQGFLFVSRTSPSEVTESKITLDPSILVVSCERLKSLFLTELGLVDRWQGTVSLMIDPASKKEKEPRLTAIYRPNGWTYSLELPKTIETRVLARALLETLFLEVANRNAGSQCAEIPCWLVEGMGAQLKAFNFPTYILQPGVELDGNRVKLEGLDMVRSEFRRHAPLSFQELSWPTDADKTGDGLELYRTCAQLFLEQLLQFDDGRALLVKMLQEMPDHLNWQTAFLSAFHPHFQQLLDVEKWWGLSCVDFTKSDIAEPLTSQNSWKDLQDALDVPVQVHFEAEKMPAEAKITLQEVITQWSPSDAIPALERATEQLKFLHLRASLEFRPLVDQYLKVLAGYLNSDRGPRLEWTLGKNHPSVFKLLKSDTVEQLDALDKHREAFRPQRTASDKVRQLSALGHAK